MTKMYPCTLVRHLRVLYMWGPHFVDASKIILLSLWQVTLPFLCVSMYAQYAHKIDCTRWTTPYPHSKSDGIQAASLQNSRMLNIVHCDVFSSNLRCRQNYSHPPGFIVVVMMSASDVEPGIISGPVGWQNIQIYAIYVFIEGLAPTKVIHW